MSQQKVDQYKKEKSNRKKILAKQKRQAFLRTSVVCLVIIAFVGFFGYSIYKDYIYKEPTNTEPTTYSLSEKEITSVWNAYSEEKTSPDETTGENSSNETTSTETASEDETTSAE